MILVAGDAMRDIYWFGDVVRISPEAPVPVVKVIRQEERLGAAANVAKNCESMGAEVRTAFSCSFDGENAVRKIRVVGRNQQVARVDFDHRQEPVSFKAFLERLEPGCVVVFSDYGKGALQAVHQMIRKAKDRGSIVLVDPKGHDFTKYAGADVLKPNLQEMRDVVGGWSGEDALREKASALRGRLGVGSILLTRAEEGMTLFTAEGWRDYPSRAREVFDVTSAGDTAIAALACALDRGYELEKAVDFANRAAGIAVSHFGTTVLAEKEVFGDA